MTNYKEKYFKYKLKYLKLKGGKIINGGGIKFNGEQWVPTNDLPYSILEAELFNNKKPTETKYFKEALEYILENINEEDISLIIRIYEKRLAQDTKKFTKHKKREAKLGISIDKSILQKHSDITKLYEEKLEALNEAEIKEPEAYAERKPEAEAYAERKPEAEAYAERKPEAEAYAKREPEAYAEREPEAYAERKPEAEAEPAMPPIKLPDSVIPIELYELNILISKFDLNIDEYQYIRDLPNIIHNIEDIIDKSLDLFMNSKITRKENSKIIREEVKDYIKLIKLNLELLEKPDEDRRWANYDEEGNPVKRGYNSAIDFFRKNLKRMKKKYSII